MMKNILLIAFIAVIISAGCKKAPKVGPQSDIIGTWELRLIGGGIDNLHQVYSPGNGSTFTFSADNTYNRYSNFQLSSQGTYQIVPNAISFGGSLQNELYFNQATPGYIVEVKSDTLTIIGTGIEASGSIYVKQ
jgi:hypothetical protein